MSVVQNILIFSRRLQARIARFRPRLFKPIMTVVFTLVVLGSFTFLPAQAQVQCPINNIQQNINQDHVFCGEWDTRRNRPKGFHSRPSGQNPATVQNFNITAAANTQGIYEGRWAFTGHSTPTKFSTMFPDSCTQAQVVTSIAYASQHPASCPSGAPTWARCGPNTPAGGGATYCQANNGTTFAIAFATLNNGTINTAFPIRQ